MPNLKAPWTFLLVLAAFLFGVALMVLDELLSVALYMAPPQTYPYPVGGPLPIWVAWNIAWTWVLGAAGLGMLSTYKAAKHT